MGDQIEQMQARRMKPADEHSPQTPERVPQGTVVAVGAGAGPQLAPRERLEPGNLNQIVGKERERERIPVQQAGERQRDEGGGDGGTSQQTQKSFHRAVV
jgi:hypothetical protein